MYQHAQDSQNLIIYMPSINVRSGNKIKFKNSMTVLTKVQKSPYNTGVSTYDMLPAEVHRATTKVRFKKLIKYNIELKTH